MERHRTFSMCLRTKVATHLPGRWHLINGEMYSNKPRLNWIHNTLTLQMSDKIHEFGIGVSVLVQKKKKRCKIARLTLLAKPVICVLLTYSLVLVSTQHDHRAYGPVNSALKMIPCICITITRSCMRRAFPSEHHLLRPFYSFTPSQWCYPPFARTLRRSSAKTAIS